LRFCYADEEVAEPVSHCAGGGVCGPAQPAGSAPDDRFWAIVWLSAVGRFGFACCWWRLAFLDSRCGVFTGRHYSYARWELAAWADDLADSRAVAERLLVGELHSLIRMAVEWVAAGDWAFRLAGHRICRTDVIGAAGLPWEAPV